jgi:hypothetical protein
MPHKRRPGRPEIGGRVTIALGPLLARIDAIRGRTSRASWLRSAAEHALTCPDTARTAKPDTEETP